MERMERFGDELRGERERRGVSIETICSVTKVSSRHLQALEANRFGDMPGGVFRKGILRSYLETLGIEQDPWMQRFEQALREMGIEAEPDPDWAEFAVNVKRNRLQRQRGLGMRWLGVAALLALVGILAWAAWHYVAEPKLRTQSDTAASPSRRIGS
jgi:cytoskeletal protein RodZ